MTVLVHPSTDQVAVAWIRSIPGLTADGVATQLPRNSEESWAANGFVVVPTAVGGTPGVNMPVHMPVCQVECWGTVPGSIKLPWGIPANLASQIVLATYDRLKIGRSLVIVAGGITFPVVRVLSATALTEPRRIWSDEGDFAGYTFDLSLHWVAQGEVSN